MIDPINLILLPILGDTIHHPPAILGIFPERLLDDQSVDLSGKVVVLLDHVRYLSERRRRESQLQGGDRFERRDARMGFREDAYVENSV